MHADNIFRLVHHFGAEEDQVSASFAFMLSRNESALEAFLEECGLRTGTRGVEIEVQVPYEGRSSVIDIVVRKRREFLVFVESKIWGRALSEWQLSKYAKVLNRRKQERDVTVRLVAVTQTDQRARFERLSEGLCLDEKEVLYFRWMDLHEMLQTGDMKGRGAEIGKMYDAFMGEMMKDRIDIKDLKVGDLEEVLVQATDDDFWEVNREHHFCTQKMVDKNGKEAGVPGDAMFVAFYRTDPVSAITHIARVRSIDLYVPSEVAYKGTSLEERARREWQAKDKVYRFDPPVELPRPVPKGTANPIRNFRYTTVSKLLDAQTIADL